MNRPDDTRSNRIELFDTTLRDGTQGEHVTLSARDKVRIARKLDGFGIDVIEGGWPGSNPKDQEFFRLARDESWETAAICAFGSTRRRDNAPDEDPNLQALIDAETSTVSIFGKSWILHSAVVLGVSENENLDLIHSSIAFLRLHGKRVIYDAEHFFDGFKDNEEYALKTLRTAAEAGADTLVLCDTNGGTLPTELASIAGRVANEFDQTIGIHTHNDSGCAVANAIVAVEAGARHVQGTINGIGERCGNSDLCSIIAALQLKSGFSCIPADNVSKLFDLSHFIDEVANLDPVDRAPFVGRSAFAHKGGIHVSAVMKEPKAYEHIEPEQVGNRRRVLVSDLSGRSNVRYKAEEMGIALDTGDRAGAAADRLKALENIGYSFEGAEASFELLVRSMQGEMTSYFTLERLRVRSEKGEAGHEYSEATVALKVGEKRAHVVSEGIGPVDAISLALKKALVASYEQLENVHLSDYKVRVIDPENGTGAAVRVLIEHHSGHETWNTVGVSTNIIEASWQALADGICFYLLKAGVTPLQSDEPPALS
jgi:2-isopropylmalate synthase